MLKKVAVAALVLLLTSAHLLAGPRHGLVATSGALVPGKAQLNVGQGDFGQAFINLWHSASINYNGSTPAALDGGLFPVRNFSGLIDGQLNPSGVLSTTGPWVFSWDAGRGCIDIEFLKAGTASNVSSGVTILNGAGSGNFTVTGTCGQVGSVTINWNDTGIPTFRFRGTYSLWGGNTTGRIYMVRQSDLAAYNAGVYWTPEIVSTLKALGPESLRAMGWNILVGNNPGTNEVNWSYRRNPTALSFTQASSFPPGTRCGGATSFCTITVSANQATAAPAADTPLGGWVDGEQITGALASPITPMAITGVGNNGGKCQITVASTADLSPGMTISLFNIGGATECTTQRTTILTVDSGTTFTANVAKTGTVYTSGGNVAYQTLTITGKSGGAKLIWSLTGTPLNFSSASGNVGFTYNAVLDAVLVNTNGGILSAVPLEAQVQLANLVGSNYWYNVPTMASDDFITNGANTIYANLSVSLSAIYEWANEIFNFGQNATQFSTQMGWALGIATTDATPYQSLRIRQIMGNLLPASNWSAAMSRLERVYCFQAGFTGTSFATGPMQGSSLISPGSAKYQAYVGGSAVNYNTYPNRPVDFVQSECYAYYIGGGSAFSGQSIDTPLTPSVYDKPLLDAVIAAQNINDTSTVSSLIDGAVRGDILNRVQTVTASGTVFTTPSPHNFSVDDGLRLTVSGGTAYSGLDLNSPYHVLSTPTSTTFTLGKAVNGSISAVVNAGTPGTGTMSVGYLQRGFFGGAFYSSTVFGYMNILTKFQQMALTGFSPAPAGGNLNVRAYEGNLVPTEPTTAQCTAIGISTPDCAYLAPAVTVWKNSALARATTDYFFKVFKGLAPGVLTTGVMTTTKAPSWLALQGPSIWSMNANNNYVAPALYQTYYGFGDFSTNPLNFLLKRDLDPASNDNDPMWLEKAA